MSPTQVGRFLALGETIVRTHLNLLLSIQQPLEQITISAVNSIGYVSLLLFNPTFYSPDPHFNPGDATADIASALCRIDNPLSTSTEPILRPFALSWTIQISAILETSV